MKFLASGCQTLSLGIIAAILLDPVTKGTAIEVRSIRRGVVALAGCIFAHYMPLMVEEK
tara:strand:+ start:7724 stop:7900 length:177 start_codon:yes stop_codon:yes gene_type:complete